MKHGQYKHDCCLHASGQECEYHEWKECDEIPEGAGEAVREGDVWYIRPSPLYCAMCPAYMEARVDEIADAVSSTPLHGLRSRYECRECHAKGLVAVSIKCTSCGDNSYWGWWP